MMTVLALSVSHQASNSKIGSLEHMQPTRRWLIAIYSGGAILNPRGLKHQPQRPTPYCFLSLAQHHIPVQCSTMKGRETYPVLLYQSRFHREKKTMAIP